MTRDQQLLLHSQLVQQDSIILLDAPLVLDALQDQPLTPSAFLTLLIDGLSCGYRPEEWMETLLATGQLSIAQQLARRLPIHQREEFERRRDERLREFEDMVEKTRARISANRRMLGVETTTMVEMMLSRVMNLAEQLWLNRAHTELDEIGRFVTEHLRAALKQREERFENARDMIRVKRRELIRSGDGDVREPAIMAVIRELFWYADQLSESLDCDLDEVRQLCEAIGQLLAGGSVSDKLLTYYRSRYNEYIPAPLRTPVAGESVTGKISPIRVTPETAGPRTQGSLSQLSPAVLTFLEQLLGPRVTLLHHDLMQVTRMVSVIPNGESAQEAQNEIRRLEFNISKEQDENARAEMLMRFLQISLSLLRYWTERRTSIRSATQRDLSRNLVIYALERGNHLLLIGQHDAACEYYRLAIRLRAPRLVGIRRAVVPYLALYAGLNDPTVLPVEKDLENPILIGLTLALEVTDVVTSTRVLRDMIKLANSTPQVLDLMKDALEVGQTNGVIAPLIPALEQMRRVLGVTPGEKLIVDVFVQAVDMYSRFRRELDDLLRQIRNTTWSVASLVAMPGLVRQLHNPAFLWDSTDLELIDKLLSVLDVLSHYLTTELPFQDRDRLAESLLDRDLPTLVRLIHLAPTEFGVLYLTEIIDQIQLVIEESRSTLRSMSLPKLQVHIEQSEWRSDGYYYCHVTVMNIGEIRADAVLLRVDESPLGEYDVVGGSEQLGTLLYNQPRPLLLRIKPRLADTNQHALTLVIGLQYRVPGRPYEESRTFQLRVDHFEARREQFVPFDNPYVVGGIVEDNDLFKGRGEIIDVLLQEIANPHRASGSVVIFGQKRSGKSSLLFHMQQKLPNFVVPVFFDMPRVLATLPTINRSPTSQREVLREELLGRLFLAMIKATVRACKKHDLDIASMDWDELMQKPGPDYNFQEFLGRFHELYPDYRILFLLDEFTALVEKIDKEEIDSSIMKLFKSLVEQRLISCIICGLADMYEAVLRFANQLAAALPRQVDYLDDRAASGLIQDPIKMPDGRSRFSSQQVVDAIIALTAGNPFYIQMFCFRLVEYMHKWEIDRVTLADIIRVTESLVTGSGRIDPVQFDNLYLYKDTRYDTREAVLEGLIVHLLAHETVNREFAPAQAIYRRIQSFVTEDDLDETLGRLTRRGTLIQQVDDPGHIKAGRQPLRSRHYRIRVDLFRHWLIANEPVDDDSLRGFERKLKR